METEYETYYAACELGSFAHEDHEECGCRAGWFLSEVDTFHTCPFHYKGQPHPEDPIEAWEAWEAGVVFEPAPVVAVVVADEDIPF
jgi:hypothetical protein